MTETKYQTKQETGYNSETNSEENPTIEDLLINSANYFKVNHETQKGFIEANEKAKQMAQK